MFVVLILVHLIWGYGQAGRWLLWFVEGEKRRERDRKKEADV